MLVDSEEAGCWWLPGALTDCMCYTDRGGPCWSLCMSHEDRKELSTWLAASDRRMSICQTIMCKDLVHRTCEWVFQIAQGMRRKTQGTPTTFLASPGFLSILPVVDQSAAHGRGLLACHAANDHWLQQHALCVTQLQDGSTEVRRV